jgi:hypothetical protein
MFARENRSETRGEGKRGHSAFSLEGTERGRFYRRTAKTARASIGGVCLHVLHRGNGRGEVFDNNEDFVAFLDLMEEASERLPMW